MMKRLRNWLLLLVLTLALLTATALAADSVPLFGRNALAGLPDGARYVTAYDAMVSGVNSRLTTINFGVSLTEKELYNVQRAYRDDHPEQYWRNNNEYNYPSAINNTCYYPRYYYGLTGIETAVQSYLSQVSGLTDQREIALKLHDLLCENVTYIDCDHAHTAYGALVEGRAVCEGYARAYQLLLNRLGIECFVVEGTGNGENHAWNMAKLNGSWVLIDVTWDDPLDLNEIFYEYFACTNAQFTDHTPATDYPYSLPQCTDPSMGVYTAAAGSRFTSLSQLTPAALAALAVPTEGNGREICFVYEGNVSEALTKIHNNLWTLVYAIGGTGDSYSYSPHKMENGHEIHFFLNGDFLPFGWTLSGSVSDGHVRWQATGAGSATVVAAKYRDGRMLSCETVSFSVSGTTGDTTDFTLQSGETCRIFLLDANQKPLCDAVTVA